jgi:hypothetical protein
MEFAHPAASARFRAALDDEDREASPREDCGGGKSVRAGADYADIVAQWSQPSFAAPQWRAPA